MCAVCVWVCVCVIYTVCVYVIYIYCEFKYGIRVMYTVYVWVYIVSVVSLWCTQCMYVSGSVAYMIYTVCISVSVLFVWCTVCECKCGIHTVWMSISVVIMECTQCVYATYMYAHTCMRPIMGGCVHGYACVHMHVCMFCLIVSLCSTWMPGSHSDWKTVLDLLWLQMVASCCVGAGNQNQALCKSSHFFCSVKNST